MAKINSNSNKAKRIIRSEIKSHDWTKKSLKNQVGYFIDTTRKNRSYGVHTPYQGGLKLVDGGSFACYYSQTDDMLGKIYGKRNVAKWSDEKKWNTYRHLIARETDSIIRTNRMTVGKRKK